jgi:hypothetical protein
MFVQTEEDKSMAINTIITTSTTLTRTRSPSLPLATNDYSRQYQDQLNNVLRLYFATIDNFVAQLNIQTTYLVADLPSAADAGVGARAFVTDSSVATFGSTVVGGGSSKVPIYSDGAAWKVG